MASAVRRQSADRIAAARGQDPGIKRPKIRQQPIPAEYRQLIERRAEQSYSEDDRENIALITIGTYGSSAQPYGSAAYRMQQYPGDLDLFENIITVEPAAVLARDLAKSLKRVVKRIEAKPLHYVTELKCGTDDRYAIDMGRLVRRSWIKRPIILASVLNKLGFDKEIVRAASGRGTAAAYNKVHTAIRTRHVLRWTAADIVAGSMSNWGREFTLVEAVATKGSIKLDMVALADGRFIEVTNYIQAVSAEGPLNGEFNPLDVGMRMAHYRDSIKKQIDELVGRDGNYFKAAKRMWAYARVSGFQGDVITLAPLVAGPISMVYQAKSELGAMKLLLERAATPPKQIGDRVSELRVTLSHSPMDSREVDKFTKKIDSYAGANSDMARTAILGELADGLDEWISAQTLAELKRIKFWPIPDRYMPTPTAWVAA